MLKLFRSKPKGPKTPIQIYGEYLDRLVGTGLLVGFVAAALAAVLRAVGDEWRHYSAIDFLAAALLIIICLSALPFIGKMYVRTRARVMEYAPVDDAAAEKASPIPMLDTGQVRYSDVLETHLPSFVHIYETVRRPRLFFGVMAVAAAVCGIAMFVGALFAFALVVEAIAGADPPMRREPGVWAILGVCGLVALLTIYTGFRMFRHLRGCIWARPARVTGRTQAIINIDTDQGTADLLGVTERPIQGGGWYVSEGLRRACRGSECGGPDECTAARVSRETEA